ncbi:MAG: sulfate adenylyltransferase [Deltaproteobacteria bacterium]|jgi:sulfate adenylyltransferase large subunit|nr:sulfate adenylyltransferase [Deltaproteobacteria bacterium]
MSKSKEYLKLVVTGHVDHGKSSVIGRLLHDTGAFTQGAVDKVKRIAKETGKPFEFAYLLDAFEEEQKQGITIDMTELQFHTAFRDYMIIDAPGHKEFLKNMISGAAGAEAAFLVIDAARGVEEQTKRHTYMLSLLGISQVCVIVNKMDLVEYSSVTFETIKEEMTRFANSLDLAIQNFIPLSALLGENILSPSEQMPWYTGATLIQALDWLIKEKPLDSAPLRLPLQDVYKFDDRRILAGRVESGTIKAGEEIMIFPGGKKTRVSRLVNWPESIIKNKAAAGESIGIILEDEFFNQRGEIISQAETAPIVGTAFRASIFWMGKTMLLNGSKYKLKIATQEVDAEIAALVSVLGASTLLPGENADGVRLNDVAVVIIRTSSPIAFDLFSKCKTTGRFVLVDGYNVAGGGIITAAEDATTEFIGFVHKDLRARCEVFEEYCYSVTGLAISKYKKTLQNFTLGDTVPLSGLSYDYPEFFDIVVNRDRIVIKIRAKKIADILPLAEFIYEGLPMVNGRGFGFKVKSSIDWKKCMADYAALAPYKEAEFAIRWLDFSAFRRIAFSDSNWEI